MVRTKPMASLIIWCIRTLICFRVSSQTGPGRAAVPPRGWNSYDSFSWIISEEEFLKNAEIVANRLKSQGYEVGIGNWLTNLVCKIGHCMI